jgi:hypothetical protein
MYDIGILSFAVEAAHTSRGEYMFNVLKTDTLMYPLK